MRDDSGVDADYTDHAVAAWADRLPDADLPTLELAMRLRRVVNELDRRLASVIDGSPLATYGDYQVLSLLRRNPQPLQPSTIAETLRVSRSGTTGRLQRLEQLNLVNLRPDPHDARQALISLTAKGRRLIDRLITAGLGAQSTAFAELTASQRRTLSELLRTVLISVLDTPATRHSSQD